jgi:hypothetical protein
MRHWFGLIVVPAILSFTGCRAPGVGSIDVDVLPAAVVLAPGGTQAFTAIVTGSSDGSVTWHATCGQVVATSAGASYTAPATHGSCTVTATSVVDSAVSGSALVTVDAAPAGDAAWLRHFGGDDGVRLAAESVAVDPSGHVLVAGHAAGAFAGVAFGGTDAFVLALDAAGGELWRRQFGSASGDWASAVAGAPDGRTLATGTSAGDLGGAGDGPVFLAAFDGGGEPVWLRRFGETLDDHGVGVAVDPEGAAYVVWYASSYLGSGVPRSFLSKFDPDGVELWRRPFADDYPFSALTIAEDGGAVVAAGAPAGVLVVVFGADGVEQGRQVHPVEDHVEDVALTGDGRSWIVGSTLRAPEGGGTLIEFEAYLQAHDADGELRWRRQFGSDGSGVHGLEVAVDGVGDVLLAGAMEWSGSIEAAWTDAFVIKIADGDVVWRRQFSSDGTGAWPTDATFAPDGAPVVVGGSIGALEPAAPGPLPVVLRLEEERDRKVFVMKLNP